MFQMPMSSPMMKTMLGLLVSAACAAVAMNATHRATAHCLSMFVFGFIVFCFDRGCLGDVLIARRESRRAFSQTSWALHIRPWSNTSAGRSARRTREETERAASWPNDAAFAAQAEAAKALERMAAEREALAGGGSEATDSNG